MQREKFSSRLGFLLISAGCAIGLGNVWRFPFITGKYGGAAFVLIYLIFLLILGLPIMVMEFAVGRASQKSIAVAFDQLEPKGSKWHIYKYFGMAGNYLLMMFYTTVGGWMFIYFFKMLRGEFEGLEAKQISDIFNGMLAQPVQMFVWMVVVVILCFGVCSRGLQKGVEKITKWMMLSLFFIMIALAIRSVTLPGASEGLSFYLLPDFSKIAENGIFNSIYAAMGQSFFTLSLGIGAVAIFGSYIGRERALTGEAISVTLLDTSVALIAGLIIFPACFSFDINVGSGPSLIFITLPNVFNTMPGGRIWGALFFVFLAFAALSTIIAVFENIISFGMDLRGWSRKKAILVNLIAIILLSIPCILGYNVFKGFQPFGPQTTIQDLEDFLDTNIILPLGSLVFLTFCVTRYGWGWNNFLNEANQGKGIKFPVAVRFYVTYILPLIIIFIFIWGILGKIFPQLAV